MVLRLCKWKKMHSVNIKIVRDGHWYRLRHFCTKTTQIHTKQDVFLTFSLFHVSVLTLPRRPRARGYFSSIITYISMLGNAAHYKLGYVFSLSLTLLEPKVISLCHQYRARAACTSTQSDQALYR